jgi:hypothetical protein
VTDRPSRIDAARRRAGSAKRVAVGAAGAGFVVALLLARAGHPGQTSSGTGQTSQPASQASQSSQVESGEFDDESDDDDGGSVQLAPSSGSSSQVPTHVS